MPMSFNTVAFDDLTDQQCSTGSRWYTCSYTQTPFLGCCKSNACQHNGCPASDLTAGFLDSNPKVAAPFVSTTGSLTSQVSSIAESTSTSNTGSSKPNKASPGAIVGGVIGSIALAVLLILAAILLIYRRKRGPTSSTRMSPKVDFYEKDGVDIHLASASHLDGSSHINRRGALLRKEGFWIGLLIVVIDLPYPEPTLGSPLDRQLNQNPPVYSSVSQSNVPLLPLQKNYNTSPQTFELPSPDDAHTRHPGILDPSVNRLQNTAATPVSAFNAASATDQYPSPVSTITEGSRRGPNVRSDAEVRGYQMAYLDRPVGAGIAAEHRVDGHRGPGFTARGHTSQSPPPWSGY